MPNPKAKCKHESCSQQATGGKGYCRRHYAVWKRGGLPKARYATCCVEGCHKRVEARGRCAEHRARDYPGKSAVAAAETATPAAEATS
jgi:hypothetical protein